MSFVQNCWSGFKTLYLHWNELIWSDVDAERYTVVCWPVWPWSSGGRWWIGTCSRCSRYRDRSACGPWSAWWRCDYGSAHIWVSHGAWLSGLQRPRWSRSDRRAAAVRPSPSTGSLLQKQRYNRNCWKFEVVEKTTRDDRALRVALGSTGIY